MTTGEQLGWAGGVWGNDEAAPAGRTVFVILKRTPTRRLLAELGWGTRDEGVPGMASLKAKDGYKVRVPKKTPAVTIDGAPNVMGYKTAILSRTTAERRIVIPERVGAALGRLTSELDFAWHYHTTSNPDDRFVAQGMVMPGEVAVSIAAPPEAESQAPISVTLSKQHIVAGVLRAMAAHELHPLN